MSKEDRRLIGTVGYAMPPNKIDTVIQPSLINYARERGIHLIQVHIDRPLIDQGPFDCLLHKVYDDDWNAQLADFKSKYPMTIIIDSITDIECLNNRISMLELVNHLPVVLQEFVNHGGVLFKVYVAGDHVKCVKRKSLPDLHVSDAARFEGQGDIMPFSQISSFAAGEEDASIKDAEMPSLGFIQSMAKGLREASKLHLFNFDMIKDSREGNKYLIIDINYFPGYAKVPGFETMLTDFFCDVIKIRMKVLRLPLLMWVLGKMSEEIKQKVAQKLQTINFILRQMTQ